MTLYDDTPEIRALLRSGPLDTCTIADIFLDDGMLHYSDLFHPVTINDGISGNITYQPLGDRLIPPDEISQTQSLDDTSIDLFLDSSRISDSSDPIGALIDSTILQRRIRLVTVLFEPDSNRQVAKYLFDVRNGVINGLEDDLNVGARSALALRIASGTFAYNERRLLTYSDADQQELYPNDTAFERIALLAGLNLPWRGEFR